MRTLVISDVHGNLPALEKVLTAEKGFDQLVSLGDVVNYGPWSNECVDLVESHAGVNLIGNHEMYFIDGTYPGKSALVQAFFKQCIKKFNRIETIRKYREAYVMQGYQCQHTVGELYVFADTDVTIDRDMIIGHSHSQFRRLINGHTLVNVGSVGQNRREINVIQYAVMDMTSGKIELREMVYDHRVVIQKMTEEKYPQECINYYQQKAVRA